MDKKGRKIRADYEQLIGNKVEPEDNSKPYDDEDPRVIDAKKTLNGWLEDNDGLDDPEAAFDRAEETDSLPHSVILALQIIEKNKEVMGQSNNKESIIPELESIKRLAGM